MQKIGYYYSVTMFKVTVKWNKEKFDMEVNADEAPLVFKAQLFALSGVLPERQKIMFKGKTLGDSWDGFDLKDGCQLMMIGSADSVPQAPAAKTVFVEDMTEGQLARIMALPVGLKNLGENQKFKHFYLLAGRKLISIFVFLRKYLLYECHFAMLKNRSRIDRSVEKI